MMTIEKRREYKSFFEVKLSQALSWNDFLKYLNNGDTLNFIVTPDKKIILGAKGHVLLAKQNGLDFNDVLEDGSFNLREGEFSWLYWEYVNKNIEVQNEIKKFLKSKGINFKER